LILDVLGPNRLNVGQRHDLMKIVEDRHGRSSVPKVSRQSPA
jgi:hypothetical protein